MEKREKTEYRFQYKEIHCEIIFFTMDFMKNDSYCYKNGGIWTSYFFIKKDHPLFKKVNITRSGWSKHVPFNYSHLNELIEMHGDITFYEKIFDRGARLAAIKIGNDYNHIWNGGEDMEGIKKDLEETIDKLLETNK